MHQHKLELVWDVDKFRCHTGDIEIAVTTLQFPPFEISAVVEAQDTCLILGNTDEIRDPGNRPVWYFASKIESQAPISPGQVIIRNTHPVRLQAIVYDIEQEPICRPEWINLALRRIIVATDTYKLASVQMPLLGTVYGNIADSQFVQLLLDNIFHCQPTYLKHLWIVAPADQCERVFKATQKAIIQKR